MYLGVRNDCTRVRTDRRFIITCRYTSLAQFFSLFIFTAFSTLHRRRASLDSARHGCPLTLLTVSNPINNAQFTDSEVTYVVVVVRSSFLCPRGFSDRVPIQIRILFKRARNNPPSSFTSLTRLARREKSMKKRQIEYVPKFETSPSVIWYQLEKFIMK